MPAKPFCNLHPEYSTVSLMLAYSFRFLTSDFCPHHCRCCVGLHLAHVLRGTMLLCAGGGLVHSPGSPLRSLRQLGEAAVCVASDRGGEQVSGALSFSELGRSDHISLFFLFQVVFGTVS